MNTSLFFVGLSCGIVGLIFGLIGIVYAQEDFETYTNEDYGFSIGYPSDSWEVEETNLQEYQVVSFLSSDDTPAAISIFIFEVLPNITLQDVAKYDDPNVNTRDISVSNTTLSGLPAVEKTMYQYEFGTSAKVKRVAALSGEDLISIRYIAEPGNFDVYLPVFDQMVQSFKLGVN